MGSTPHNRPMEVALGEFADAESLLLLAAGTALAVVTNYGARLGARGMRAAEACVVALGMVPRGEVGIIVAGIGAAAGVVVDQLFAVIVGMSVLTTSSSHCCYDGRSPPRDRRPAPAGHSASLVMTGACAVTRCTDGRGSAGSAGPA
jgi:Kef-type K+ transport system membrane component KefB